MGKIGVIKNKNMVCSKKPVGFKPKKLGLSKLVSPKITAACNEGEPVRNDRWGSRKGDTNKLKLFSGQYKKILKAGKYDKRNDG